VRGSWSLNFPIQLPNNSSLPVLASVPSCPFVRVYVCVCVTGIWILGLILGRQTLYHFFLALSPALFFFFSGKSSFLPSTDLDLNPTCGWDSRLKPPCPAYWLRRGLANFFWLVLALDYDPPNLCLLNSWDYRHNPLHCTQPNSFFLPVLWKWFWAP
jgi:hypothetical protein